MRQIKVLMAQGKSLALACKEAEISEQSYYRWRKEYVGIAVEQAKRLRELEYDYETWLCHSKRGGQRGHPESREGGVSAVSAHETDRVS